MNKAIQKLDTLSGIGFEKICFQLFQKMGYEVKSTKTTGDGGVDLFIYNDQPITCGKYIVQCKRYKGTVGESVVRDLYGVVMSERANKGILLTTGKFSKQAKTFAKDKQLELIDGTLLSQLLLNYDIINNEKLIPLREDTDIKSTTISLYRKMLYNGQDTESIMKDYLEQLLTYLPKGDIKNILNKEDIYSGETCTSYDEIIDELEMCFNYYIDKYYKRGKIELIKRTLLIDEYVGITNLFRMNLFEFVIKKHSILQKYPLVPLLKSPAYYNLEEKIANIYNITYYHNGYFELMNMYSIFRYFNIPLGIKYVNKVINTHNNNSINSNVFNELQENEFIYKYLSQNKKLIILKPDFFVCYACKNDREVYNHIISQYNQVIDLTSYYDKLGNNEKIKNEINEINIFLRAQL